MSRSRVYSFAWWLAQTGSFALLFTAVVRIRIMSHCSGVGLDAYQDAMDHVLGTWGTVHIVVTLIAGAGLFCALWLWGLALALLRGVGRRESVTHLVRVLDPAAGMAVSGVLLLISPIFILPAMGIAVFAILLVAAGLFLGGRCTVSKFGQKPPAAWRRITAALLLALPFAGMAAAYRYGRQLGPVENVLAQSQVCILSFDTEEDWWPKEDQQISEWPPKTKRLKTFKYIESGILERLAVELAKREVHAVFYCTPEMASAHPQVVAKLAGAGHEIGVHVHMEGMETRRERTQAICQAKGIIESASGHPAVSFRSGSWMCDPSIEAACQAAPYRTLSNHGSTFMLPSGIVHLRAAKNADVLRSPSFAMAEGRKSPADIALFSHPMILYDHTANQPREDMLLEFLTRLDEFRDRVPAMRFITAGQFASEARYMSPPLMRTIAVGVIAAVFVITSVALAVGVGGQVVLRDWRKASGKSSTGTCGGIVECVE